MSKKHVILCAWEIEHDDKPPTHHFEVSNQNRLRRDNVRSAGIVRDGVRVTVYCDCFHQSDPLEKSTLREIATAYHNGQYQINNIDFRK